MKIRKSLCMAILFVLLKIEVAFPQPLTGYTFKVVNMIPNAQSNEVRNDAETNIAVNPANPSMIAGSAFTNNPTGSTTSAPIFISTNSGNTWALNNIVPSGNGRTGDISLGFGSAGGNLYAGILRGGSYLRGMMLRTGTPTANTMMTILNDRSTELVDQPFITSITVNDAMSVPRDRVFSGDNLYGSGISSGGTGRTAEVMVSNNAASSPFTGFTNRILEVRNTFEQDMPATRMAIHNSGVVYGIFYSWISGLNPNTRNDVVVVRDDNFATGATPFGALVDAGDALAGQRVVTNTLVPAFPANLGNNRLVASNLAIAVDPGNAANVFIAWCDRVGATDYTVHLRRSTNSGQNWSADLITVTNATNPGIAITTAGVVGFVYQQLTGAGATARWETHFRLCTTITGTGFTDDILSSFLDSDLNISPEGTSFLGDYLRIQAVGASFYGVFPAGNRAVNANFPKSVTYQRNVNFATNQLRNTTNTANVNVSVDPFFFKISPTLVNICVVIPEICKWRYIDRYLLRIPEYICLRCPWPCFQCPPFEIRFEDIYTEVFKTEAPKTILTIPYFHLMLDGFNPDQYEVNIVTTEGDAIRHELNKTAKGYAISFRPSKMNYDRKQGIHGLKLTLLPKTAEAAHKASNINYNLLASDYRYKEFAAQQK